MVSRRGATKRKKVKPIIVEEPPLVVNCICCHCEAVFRPLDVIGEYLYRKCPSCGGILIENAYDEAYEKVAAEIICIEKEISLAAADKEKWCKWSNRFRWIIFKPIKMCLIKRLRLHRLEKVPQN